MSIRKRGFGSMDAARQREIARKGGQSAHAKGAAHEWTVEEARIAGRKGGVISRGGRGRLPVADGSAPAPVPVPQNLHTSDKLIVDIYAGGRR